MASQYSVILTTAIAKDDARAIAKSLLQGKLAACVQLLPVETFYMWQGDLVEGDEVLLLIKTRNELYTDVETAILRLHAYEVPEIIQLQVDNGLPAYLKWIRDVT